MSNPKNDPLGGIDFGDDDIPPVPPVTKIERDVELPPEAVPVVKANIDSDDWFKTFKSLD